MNVGLDYSPPVIGRAHRGALCFALVFPTFVTYVYFVWLAGRPSQFQQAAYLAGKAIQFGFPLAWTVWTLRRLPPLRFSTRNWRAALRDGVGFGGLIAAAMLTLYFFLLKPSGWFDGPAAAVQAKVAGLGLATPARFVLLGVFYSLCHSLLEEYYWRWFVFGQLRREASFSRAAVVSSLGFMAHHVILLAVYFSWTSWVTYLFSLGVAVGGFAWAWIYERTGSLWATWLSHLLVDAAIFVIGYDLLV